MLGPEYKTMPRHASAHPTGLFRVPDLTTPLRSLPNRSGHDPTQVHRSKPYMSGPKPLLTVPSTAATRPNLLEP